MIAARELAAMLYGQRSGNHGGRPRSRTDISTLLFA